MPEAVNCRELQFAQNRNSIECTDRELPEPGIPQELRLVPYKKSSKCTDARVPTIRKCEEGKIRDSPRNNGAVKFTECPNADDTKPTREESPSAGANCANMMEILRSQQDDDCTPPLGPFPPTSFNEPTPMEYWAPLADYSRSRPAVEPFSVTRYSPAEWRLHDKRIYDAAHESIHRERFAKYFLRRYSECRLMIIFDI